nr:hypothetical protein [Tanacetum cinerariifolium]
FWHVIPSGEMKFEVRHGSISFTIDEQSRTCGCKLWKLSGISCEHAIAVIYYLNINPDNYISDWYKKPSFIKAYNHYIFHVPSSDQWLPTDYTLPLPPKARRMPGRPRKNQRRDAFEGSSSTTRVFQMLIWSNNMSWNKMVVCFEKMLLYKMLQVKGGGGCYGGERVKMKKVFGNEF